MKRQLQVMSLFAAISVGTGAVPAMAAGEISVSGVLKPGYTLTAECGGDAQLSWYRCGDNGEETLIEGADGKSYTLVNADGGKKIKVEAKSGEEISEFVTDSISAPVGPLTGRESNFLQEFGNASYQFAIEDTGEKFILLNTTNDEKGKFYVLSYNTYGSYQFDFSGNTSSSSQKFDPDYDKGIAYWLNNDFKTSGNGGLKMSPVIFDYIDEEHEWFTEGGHANGKCPNDYIVKAGLSFLSYSELYEYKDKFGWRDGMPSGSSGWWLRTGRGTNPPDVYICKVSEAGTFSDYAYKKQWVRPAFYLSEDFFKNVRIKDYGENVKEVISATYEKGELGIYSNEELENGFGYPKSEIAEVSVKDLNIMGNAKPGYTLRGSYIWDELNEEAEGNSQIRWYSCESPDGTGEIISGVEGLEYTLKNSDAGKYIRIEVTPITLQGNIGESVSFTLQTPVSEAEGPITDRESNILEQFGSEAYQFALKDGGEKFILLDSTDDDKGKFFILSYNTYGSYQFDFSGATASSSQKFDPDYDKSIAYWLNNDFKASGNGNFKMSPVIFDYIDEDHEWFTEGGHADGKCPDDYVVRAGLNFLSHGEFYKYKDKFGWRDGMPAGSSGWWLRTGRGSGKIDVWMCSVNYQGTFSDYAYKNEWVRPAFYLSKDFFAEVPIELASAGAEVKKLLKSTYSANELSNLYSEEELKTYLGYMDYDITNVEYKDEAGNEITDLNGIDCLVQTAVFTSLKEDTEVYMFTVLYNVNGAMKKVAMTKGDAQAGEQLPLSCTLDFADVAIESGDYLSTFFWKNMSGMYPFAEVINFGK